MNKELFVTSTPHETRVGLVEDDQLAEIYLEREGEYTLAGSIYKGRVTRVLPGMQSAFVDIGLERDAFLYVSDFFELEDQGDGEEIIPIRTAPAIVAREPNGSSASAETQPSSAASAETHSQPEVRETREPRESREGRESRGDGGPRERWGRGRRRRTGRRFDRYEQRPSRQRESAPAAQEETYGPPAGYEPIILPGESISKYRGRPATPAPLTRDELQAISALFPKDEPLFAQPETQPEPVAKSSSKFKEFRPVTVEERDEPLVALSRIPEVQDEVEEPEEFEEVEEAENGQAVVTPAPLPHQETQPEPALPIPEPISFYSVDPARIVEEQEIDEEEAELGAYAESIADHTHFEEFEEEISEPGALVPIATEENGVEPEEGEDTSETALEEQPMDAAALAEEFQLAQQQEAELEAIQEEAEAFAASGGEPVESRVEVRAPAATAAFMQRAQRQQEGIDRRRGRRGGRRPRGGRREVAPPPQITELLKEGQEVLIQIAKEPIGKKGARITSHIALPGRFLVYMPTVNHIGVSRKINSEEERMRLKRIVVSERENGVGGFIVRTAAAGAAEDELRADIRFLKSLWNEVKTRSEESKAPALIYHDLNVVERVLRDQVTSDFTQIWVDTEQEYERILRFAQRFQPALIKRIKLYTKEAPLFEQFGLQDEMNKALKSKVWLKSGGYIVVNQTEALVAIDVNTGKYVGKTARLEDTIVKTNVDAIKEIVRQIRLRDLGGIIVIDFIDMDERRNRQKVMQALEEELKNDRAPSKVLAFNDFGLVAITRKRVKQSLERTIGTPCPYCTATGFVKSATTVCNEIYIEMRKMTKHLNHADVMLRVNPEVAKSLKANNGRWLQEMEEMTKHTIIIKSDASLHQEQFDIN